MYAAKDCTEQLRRIHGITIFSLTSEVIDGVYLVTAKASNAKARLDQSTGAVSIEGLKGEALANAMMKAETKAKRRVTLSIAGLGWLDESETSSIQSGVVVDVDIETGEMKGDDKWDHQASKRKIAEAPQKPPAELKRAKAAPFD